MVFVGFVGAAVFASSGVASEVGPVVALAPTTATAAMVSEYVERYAVRESVRPLRHTYSDASAGHATNVNLYPTADREVVFVSFRIAGSERIALVETSGNRVTRFTDFAGKRPKVVSAAASQVGDAQAQARSILSSTPSAITKSQERVASGHQRFDAQQQAAELLQFASPKTTSTKRPLVTVMNVPKLPGDSQKLARALLTSSSAE